MQLTDIDINNYYLRAIEDFKECHPEWICTIHDGALIIQLNQFSWKNFSGRTLSSGEKQYRHIVIIRKNGTVIDHDMYVSEENIVGLGEAKISKKMFLGESGSYSYSLDLNGENESGCQDQPKGESSEVNIQKFICGYFESQGLKFYSPTRLWLGIAFIATMVICDIIMEMFIPGLPWFLRAYMGMFVLLGIYLVVTCKQAFNTLKLAGVVFMFVPMAFLTFWPMLDDIFMKLIFGFFIVVFFPIGIGMYVAGYKEDNA